jgi:hypothetical protein
MGGNVEMMMEGMASPVTHQTLAAWRSTFVQLRDEERRHAVGLSLETGRLLEIVGQALAQGGGVLPPNDFAQIEALTGIGAQYRAVN